MTDRMITAVGAMRVWDSRGHPTVEVQITLSDGTTARAIAPAGASRGSREAVDLRDGGTRLKGLDVQQALANVAGPIARALIGRDVADQAGGDAAMIAADASPFKSGLGGNAVVATSLAMLHAAAAGRCGSIWHRPASASRPSLCPRSRFSAAGRMPGVVWMCRISW